jgi:predicted nucleic acid-binding protein
MTYLFDTDAISEVLKPRPAADYLAWLGKIPRENQYTSAICVAELYKGAYKSPKRDWHIENIERRLLPALTILPFDVAAAKRYGALRAHLEQIGQRLADADLQIAATALNHNLTLVTGNVRHFQRVPDLALDMVLADSRLR